MRKAWRVTRTQGGAVRALGAAAFILAFFALRPVSAEPIPLSSEAKASVARATEAASRGRFSDVRALAQGTKDPLARALVTWLYLSDDGTEPQFGEITAFLATHPDWPDRQKILRKAERALPPHLPPSEIRAFFGTRAPLTGEGMVRLGEALIAQGERSQGEALIKRGWIEGEFTPAREQEIKAAHGALLRGAPSAARADRLLWARRLSEAQRLLGDLDGEAAALANARISLMIAPSRAETVIASLPAGLRTSSGLLFEHVRAVKNTGDIRRALPLALKADPAPAPTTWWKEREALIRDALSLGLYSDAYELAKSHGLSSGPEFADAEWLAGFISLRFLRKADTAFTHFQTLLRGVSYPVSKARAAYWSGRAAEAAGKLAEAALMYEAAAEYTTTFYGQLAAVRLADREALLKLPSTISPASALRDAFLKDDVVRAAALAATSSYEPLFKRFFLHLAERAKGPEDFALAAELARNLGFPHYAVRIAKKAMQQNVLLAALAYPVVSVPEALPRGRVPEPALVLGITRQESEFDPKAVSSAGARGIMQLLPSTAKIVARSQGMRYDAGKLSDPAYNAKLGSAYLGELIDSFGGSYSLAVAAYNAGPTRVRQWLSQNGDPRDPKVDIIDWVELIPYGETRNYVQRVLENTQVYRERLAGKPVLIRLAEDLSRPALPSRAVADLRAYRQLAVAAEDASRSKAKAMAKEAPATAHASQETAAVAAAKPAAAPSPAEPASDSASAVPVPAQKPKAPATEAKEVAALPELSSASPAQAAAAPSKPEASSRTGAEAEATVLAANEADTEPALPESNPFNAGQPETMASTAACLHLLMSKDGKLRCAGAPSSPH